MGGSLFSCHPLRGCILHFPRGLPARRGHRFLFRKKAVGKNGPGEVSPGTPSKYTPTGWAQVSAIAKVGWAKGNGGCL